LEGIFRGIFEGVERDGEKIVGHFGAIARVQAWGDGRELVVDLTMNPKVPADLQEETIRRFNRFLEDSTGYSSKERAKRLRKSAQAPVPGG
jgi:hypothetical protein